MARKKSTSKKPKKPQTRNVTLSDGSKVRTDDNKAPHIKSGKVVKHVIPSKPLSTETGKKDEDWEVTDDYDKSLEYPPPRRHPYFRQIWAENLPHVLAKPNFKPAHLQVLETFCSICVEIRTLDKFIQENGFTFRTVNVMGESRKAHPEVAYRDRAIANLATYARLLDLTPKKGTTTVDRPDEDDKSEWT